MKTINRVVASFKESVFATMTREAVAAGAVNLGQGFPDFDGPSWVIELARQALGRGREGKNQYAPAAGTPAMCAAVAAVARRHYGLEYEPATEVTVTHGATEAIFSTALALIDPGDEVVVFEPFYDSYVAAIELAGGRAVPVTLHAPDFRFDENELMAALGPKTKAIFLNTPHNPSGRVFDEVELQQVAAAAKRADCLVVSDEVYEFLTFDGARHVPFATLPGMRERTVTISSTGKTFGLTGWKIGWTCAPPALTHGIRMVHQFNTFCVNHPIQLAMAEALDRLDDYLPEFRTDYARKRDLFVGGLREAGFDPVVPAGTYFTMVPIPDDDDEGPTAGENRDVAFCRKLIRERRVAAIPPSAFYASSDEGQRYVRFCFAKRDETLQTALDRLRG